MTVSSRLSLGPLFFNWPADTTRDFYAKIADEAPVDTVHLGEVVCGKRAPLLAEVLSEAAERLERAGKEVVWSTLALIAERRDTAATRALVQGLDGLIEANDPTVVSLLSGRPHVVGPMVNVYNEGTLAWLVQSGARRVCLPPELPRRTLEVLARAGGQVELEVQVFGRMPLAVSARCYHARAHHLHKDGCRYVCGEDTDGMPLETMEGENFLAVNGIQTLSHAVLDLSEEAPSLMELGIRRFRLSPHSIDMVEVARIWRDVTDGRIEGTQARGRIAELVTFAGTSNGYFHGKPGAVRVA